MQLLQPSRNWSWNWNSTLTLRLFLSSCLIGWNNLFHLVFRNKSILSHFSLVPKSNNDSSKKIICPFSILSDAKTPQNMFCLLQITTLHVPLCFILTTPSAKTADENILSSILGKHGKIQAKTKYSKHSWRWTSRKFRSILRTFVCQRVNHVRTK